MPTPRTSQTKHEETVRSKRKPKRSRPPSSRPPLFKYFVLQAILNLEKPTSFKPLLAEVERIIQKHGLHLISTNKPPDMAQVYVTVETCQKEKYVIWEINPKNVRNIWITEKGEKYLAELRKMILIFLGEKR